MLLFALLLLPVAIWLTGHLTAGTRTSRAQPLARLTRPTSWNPLEGRHVRLPPALPPASPRAAPVAPGGRGPPALRQLRVVVSEKEQCNCIAVCQAEPLARRSLLPGLPAPAAAGGIGDSNGDPCPDAGDRVANIIIIVVVITATTSPIIFQGSSDLLRAPPKPLLRGVSGAPRAMAHAEADVQGNLEAVVELIGSLHRGNIQWYTTLNNSTSTRPKDHGGINVQSMGKLRSFQSLAGGRFACTLSLPYMTAAGRVKLEARGEGNDKGAASEYVANVWWPKCSRQTSKVSRFAQDIGE